MVNIYIAPDNRPDSIFPENKNSTFLRNVCKYLIYYMMLGSRDSVFGIATDHGLDERGVGVRVPYRLEFSVLHVVQTGSGVHPTSYPMGTGAFLLGGKAASA
jgi:hypothetical protein